MIPFNSLQHYNSHTEYKCEWKNLTSVPQDIPENIEILILSNNIISKSSASDGKDLHKLVKLDMSYNKMRKVPEMLTNFGQTLYLQENEIGTINRSLFNGLVVLEQLDLSGNQLKSFPKIIPPLSSLNLERYFLWFFPKLDFNLKYLNLNKNRIVDFPPGRFIFNNISEIHLAGNKLKYVPPLYNNSFLAVLVNLTGNPLHCNVFMAWMMAEQSGGECLGYCQTPDKFKGSCINGLNTRGLKYPRKGLCFEIYR